MTRQPLTAYLIDSAAREVREVEYRAVRDLQSFVCGYIATAHTYPDGSTVFVDDEGLMKPQTAFFRLISSGNPQPLAGNGVLVGRELTAAHGDYLGTAPPGMPLEALAGDIQWLTREQADAWAKGNASEPGMWSCSVGRDGILRVEALTSMGALFGDMPRPEGEKGV